MAPPHACDRGINTRNGESIATAARATETLRAGLVPHPVPAPTPALGPPLETTPLQAPKGEAAVASATGLTENLPPASETTATLNHRARLLVHRLPWTAGLTGVVIRI